MSDEEEPIHLASVAWERGRWASFPGKYSRDHVWHFAGGLKVKASDTPFMLPDGYRGSDARIDPEKAYVATVASAHMLGFLHLALGMQVDVLSYIDEAHGTLAELEKDVYWVSEIILHPKVTLGAGRGASSDAISEMHRRALEQCFVARSIKTKVTVRAR